MSAPYRIKTISELHHLSGLPRPEHPLISVINLAEVKQLDEKMTGSRILDFYAISLKHHVNGNYKYGQQEYQAEEGVMYFIAPGQVCGPMNINSAGMAGWALYIHPDFFWHTPMAKGIHKYEYFAYAVNEALYLSEREEEKVVRLMQEMQQEYLGNMDPFSQPIIISMIETLLNFADRFYQRQFLTRKIESHQVLDRLETLLNSMQEMPTVQDVAAQLNISPNYLSSLLKVLTGKNTQQHIQDKMIEKAKEMISTTALSVSEISYELGFEHPQSFSRLFKAKTGLSPMTFRQRFN